MDTNIVSQFISQYFLILIVCSTYFSYRTSNVQLVEVDTAEEEAAAAVEEVDMVEEDTAAVAVAVTTRAWMP